jgi:energy-coupling factor transporter ATP-binding protein EcfA2
MTPTEAAEIVKLAQVMKQLAESLPEREQAIAQAYAEAGAEAGWRAAVEHYSATHELNPGIATKRVAYVVRNPETGLIQNVITEDVSEVLPYYATDHSPTVT